MYRWLFLAVVALVILAAPASAATITGQYVEARGCEIWTGPCFANAETALTGKHGMMAWKIEKGALEDVSLDGLSVVAVVVASETLGLQQTSASKAVIIVDEKADLRQRAALVRLARQQGGELVRNVVAVQAAAVDLNLKACEGGTCARLEAGPAIVETRCIDQKHDKACGNEFLYYPPLARGVKAQAAATVEHSYMGKGFNETWRESGRRCSYVGSFEIR